MKGLLVCKVSRVCVRRQGGGRRASATARLSGGFRPTGHGRRAAGRGRGRARAALPRPRALRRHRRYDIHIHDGTTYTTYARAHTRVIGEYLYLKASDSWSTPPSRALVASVRHCRACSRREGRNRCILLLFSNCRGFLIYNFMYLQLIPEIIHRDYEVVVSIICPRK